MQEERTTRIWDLTEKIIGACIEVHRQVGPGLLESAYQECLCHELRLRGHSVERQRVLQLVYKGLNVSKAYRVDLVVEDLVLLEIKAIERLLPVHDQQVLTYLRVSGLDLGLIVNFNAPRIMSGLRRLVRWGAHIGHSQSWQGAREHEPKSSA